MTRVSVQTEPRSPLAFPAYRRVFFARAVSSAGSYMQVVAASWLVYHLTNSAIAVGVLTSLALGPALVGGPIGGVLADRYDPRRLAMMAVGFGWELVLVSGQRTAVRGRWRWTFRRTSAGA